MTGTTHTAPSFLTRARVAPLWAHALALAVVLTIGLAIIGTQSIYNADEAAAAAQAKSLSDGDGWLLQHPLPAIDPEGNAFPLVNAGRAGDDGFAPFAKHPAYPLLLAGADRVGGTTAMFLLSILGTVGAATVAARLARRIDRRHELPAFWLAGVATPLLFDSYLLIAHTIAAALAGAAVLFALNALEGRSYRWWALAMVAALGTAMMRNEGVLFGLALGLALGVVWLLHRRGQAFIGGALIGATAVGAYLLDARLQQLVLGGDKITGFVVNAIEEKSSFLNDKAFAFSVTWLLPDYEFPGRGSLLMALGILIGVAAAMIARRKPDDVDGVRLFAWVAAVLVAARLAFEPAPIPGLLIAVPVLLPAAALVRRSMLRRLEPRLLALTFAFFSGAVILTQYRTGGSGEWGGRYFALGLPLLVSLLVLVLDDARGRLAEAGRRAAGGALAFALAAVAVYGVVVLRDGKSAVPDIPIATEEIAATTTPGDGGEPVVLTTDGALARFGYDRLDGERWLTIDDEALGMYLDRLADAGFAEVTLATSNPRRDLLPLPSDRYAVGRLDESHDGWAIAVLVLE